MSLSKSGLSRRMIKRKHVINEKTYVFNIKTVFKKYIGIFLLIIFLISFSLLMRVSRVECYIHNTACPSIYRMQSEDIYNKHLFLINSQQITERIEKHNPTVTVVRIVRRFPNTIVIYLEPRQAKYLLITPDQTLLADTYGKLMATENTTDIAELIPIESSESFAVGQELVSPTIRSAMKVVDLLANSGFRLRTLKVNSIDDISVILQDSLVLRINGQRDLSKQVDSIKFIQLQPAQTDQTQMHEIDVRFNDPIVR